MQRLYNLRMNTTKTITCKNCGNEFTGNYCNICGQSAHTHDINFHFIWHDIQHGLLHLEKGILYTIKELFIRPGHSVKEYIDGKRINHFKPISLVLLLAGLYVFLLHTFDLHQIPLVSTTTEGSVKLDVSGFIRSIEEHYSISQILFLPIFSLASYLAFKKFKLSYIKHLVLNAFILVQRLVVKILFVPLLYAYNGTSKMNIVIGITNLIGFAFAFWTLGQFFKDKSTFKTILRCISFFFLFLFQMIVIVVFYFFISKALGKMW